MSTTPNEEPVVPLTKALSIGELLEKAAKEIPEMDQDGVEVRVKYSESGTAVMATVRVDRVTGGLVGEFSARGEKSLTGFVRWEF